MHRRRGAPAAARRARRRSSACSRCTSTRCRRRCRRHHRRASSGSSGAGVDSTAAVAAVAALRRLAGGVPLTAFSLPTCEALGGDRSRGLSNVCARPASTASPRCRSICSTSAAGGATRRATPACRAAPDRARVAPARPAGRCSTRARDLQTRVGGFRAFAPLPRTLSVAAPTTGYDDVKHVALARLLVANIAVDPGGLVALRPEAGAGRADRRRRRRRRRGGRRSRGARAAAEPARGDSRQHPRGRPASRSSGTARFDG